MASTNKPEPANENNKAEATPAQPEDKADLAPAESEQTDSTEIEALKQELSHMRDQWMRAVAETENVRKRGERDRDEMSKFAVTAFARDMVSVLENLKRASESIPTDRREGNELLKTLAEGIDLTLQELLSIFDKYKISRIDPMGEKFDHNFHQAVVQVENPDVPPGTVVQVVQAGYVIQDRLLRPAMVAVSKQGEPPKQVDTTA